MSASDQHKGGAGRSRTRLDPEERRHQIIEAAIRAFGGKDPGDVSFEAVAEAAGVSRSLVYTYFGDRGRLFAAAYVHALSVLDEEIDAALGDVVDDRERLRLSMRSYLDFTRANPLMGNVITAAGSSRHPAVRDAVIARADFIARQLGTGPDGGLLISGVIGMLEAAGNHMLEHDDADTDELAELLTQVIWTGISSL